MSKPNDGGPFHPVALRLEQGDMAVEKLKHPGVSLRAWLAGMTSVDEGDWPDSNKELSEFIGRPWPDEFAGQMQYRSEFEARVRCAKADALIAELEKEAK